MDSKIGMERAQAAATAGEAGLLAGLLMPKRKRCVPHMMPDWRSSIYRLLS